mgnify:CR=1 FL=1
MNPCGYMNTACNALKVAGNMKVNVLMNNLNQKDTLNGAKMRAGDVISACLITSGESIQLLLLLLLRVQMVLPDGGNHKPSVFGAEIIKTP